MFRPVKIVHAKAILRKDKVNPLLNLLYKQGICQLKKSELKELEQMPYVEEYKELQEMENKLFFITDSLEPYKKVKQATSMVKSFFKPTPPLRYKINSHYDTELIEEIKGYVEEIEPKLRERLKELEEMKEKTNQNRFIIHNLTYLPEIKTIDLKSSDNIKVFTGLVTTSSLDKIKDELKTKILITTKKIDKNISLIIIFADPEQKILVEKTLHQVGFQNIEVPYENKTSSKLITELKKEIHSFEDKEKEIKSRLEKVYGQYEKKLLIAVQELKVIMDRVEGFGHVATSTSYSVVEVWIPKKDLFRLHKVLKENCDNFYLEVEDTSEGPTIYNNPKLLKPFEALTNLYSPPKCNSFDPTPLLAFFFTLFFGFMLTDFAYGVFLVIMGLLMYKYGGKYNESTRGTGVILSLFGISTMILGAFFMSYFGNFFQELGFTMPGVLDAMRDVMPGMGLAIGLGVLHLLVALIAGFYENCYQKQYKAAFENQGVWLVFLVSITFLVLKQTTVGFSLLGVAILMQLAFNFVSGGPVASILSIFDFSGFMGDAFSYARLLAMGIGTAGIALAVNFMVFLVVDMVPYVGIVLAALVFVVGHLFNMAMNGLGSFIHSTRLHFLEFFSKFYEGGGYMYRPYKADRKKIFIGG